jgi:Protein of unknown function (DUF2855)
MTQFQISRTDPGRTRVVDVRDEEYAARLGDGDALVRVDRFGLSANNITYVVLGDRLGYWQFFPAEGVDADDRGEWGVMPVWGFGDVVESRAAGLAVGERLFGYFPPATHLLMTPEGAPDRPVLDAAEHRAELPRGYNTYQRVLPEPGYDPADDDLRMLLFPLHITSWALWDTLQVATWFGAEQVVVVSASSKTAIGLAQALARDDAAPATVGVTSARNRGFVEGLGLYDAVVDYDEIESAVALRPSVIVDMAGSGAVLGRLHRHLGDAMLRTLFVGLTHWDEAGMEAGIIAERSDMFFAPGVIQARMKEWGAAEFGRRSQGFVTQGLMASREWLTVDRAEGLGGLAELYDAVRLGSMPPDRGLVVAP